MLDRALTTVILGGLLTTLAGCASSYFLPMELRPSIIQTTLLESEPAGGPTLHVLTHVDGLGWRIRVRQEWTDTYRIAEQERWSGEAYTRADSLGRQVLVTAGTVISCPGSLVAHLFIRGRRLLGFLDGPEPTWKPIKAYCVVPLLGLDPSTGHTEEQPGPLHEGTRIRKQVVRETIPGRIQIRWRHPSHDPVGIEHPLVPPQGSLDVRLREIAPVLLRTHDPKLLTQGTLEIALLTDHDASVTYELPVSEGLLRSALGPDLIRRPDSEWPPNLRVRIDSPTSALSTLAHTALTDLRIPIVTRGFESAPLRQVQTQESSPHYRETTPASIGHWTGANVLLSLTATPITPTAHLFVVSATSIETGLLLGQFTLEGPNIHEPEVSSALRAQLQLLLRPDGSAPRRGVMIEEGQP